MLWFVLAILLPLLAVANAATHEYFFNTTLVTANPDGEHERPVIGINGQWPNPVIQVAKNDRVIIHLHNGMSDRNVSLHFHGLFMESTNSMDGPEYVTQCPIPPGHTYLYDFVVKQAGTYWYHSHLGSQYSDGLRGVFIVEENSEEDYPFKFDQQVPLTVGDHYHLESRDIMKSFQSRYNPTGAEPIPQNSLFNESRSVSWNVQPDTTYYLRIVNVGMFVSQYLYIEDHELTIVEVDGVYVKPVTVDSLYLGVAQRYGVLLKTKRSPKQDSFRFVNIMDEPMLDFLPSDLKIISTNYLDYAEEPHHAEPLANGHKHFEKLIKTIHPINDMDLITHREDVLFDSPDYQIVLNFTMDNLGDGISYAFFNGISYTAPKVPTLYSVLSSGEYANHPAIYGSNTNTFVLQENEIVEIVLNNMDPGLHPFHLHGHTFQVISRSEGTDDDENPQIYNLLDTLHTHFPEHPLVRDTVVVQSNGFVVLRFKANNPGVWLFHCHVDWHLEQGLAITLVESPLAIQERQTPIHESHLAACAALGISSAGNAAGNKGDSESAWLDLSGENLQYKPLPPGFTSKGYVALFACAAAAVFGVFSIYEYGMEDINTDDTEHVVNKLYSILEKYDDTDTSAMLGQEEDI
ncbi:cell surface ferroxidase [Metschnikowia bicuspidata var. bicuspidata NRRL YB-4993]|uniref:Cell surface ferroxidase n=1 Tax=Metschnikowia bicuspidata var. bicuspidata NRRL YB-4993 TaxID=869754 RepID=A0A1A0HAY3_9ASCO|nr:cell surface ferroxidase [Metschnikowia bicuspidata var. bicuspidata NRRL YB-4993]OBA21155.1 cell surface ferroxidase [Metschnikowia bicuspidata var. bicuspidata NRRL YB-4993]